MKIFVAACSVMSKLVILSAIIFATIAFGQQLGPTPEIHPELKTHKCTDLQGCIPRETSLVLDFQWRNIIDVYSGKSCITDSGKLNRTLCPTAEECARNCALDGADYPGTGVETRGDSLTLNMYQPYRGKLYDVEPQVYLLEGGNYCMLQLLNQELSFDVDVSQLPCGMNGAMYLAGMEPSGGRSRLNPAGAWYVSMPYVNMGTGYCDSQCYAEYNFVNGVANVNYNRGTCCNEMDLWEANARSNQFTAHPCNLTGFSACQGDECYLGDHGPCDRTGCGWKPYGLGDHDFYGYGATIDTNEPFKVVTQFHTHDSTVAGDLSEIRRLYIQHGKLVQNSVIKLEGKTFDSISTEYCQTTVPNSFRHHGGLAQMGNALKRGMVLVMGIWNDPGDYNRWLDSGSAGPCPRRAGKPADIKAKHPDTSVTFSNIRWGDIGSTYKA